MINLIRETVAGHRDNAAAWQSTRTMLRDAKRTGIPPAAPAARRPASRPARAEREPQREPAFTAAPQASLQADREGA